MKPDHSFTPTSNNMKLSRCPLTPPLFVRRHRPVLMLGLSLSMAATLCAQSIPPDSAAPNEEVVKLDPFEVSSQETHGYATTSSLSASRTAVAITDLPASVITINERLIEDTVAMDIGDTLNLVSGVMKGNAGGGLQESNTVSIRGYLSNIALRDGIPDINFTDNGGFDYAMVERIEIVKGPAGVLYGQHSAGGAVNFISKRPLAKPASRIDFTYGSYNFRRAAVDHSSFFDQNRRFGYRIAAAFLDTDGPIGIGGEPEGVSSWINPSLSYQFESGLKIWLWGAVVSDSSQRVANTTWAFGTPDGLGRPYMKFLEEGTVSVVYQNFNMTDHDNFEIGATKHFNLFGAEADFRLVGRTGSLTTSAARTRANGNAVFIDRNGARIPDGNPNTGRGPNIYGQIDGNLSRFGRTGLRYNRGEEFTDRNSLTADLSLAFDLGPTSNHLLVYSELSDGSGGSRDEADGRINNVATLPADIRQQYGFDTGIANVGIAEIWPNPPAGVGDLRQVILDHANVLVMNPDNANESAAFNAAVVERMSLLDNRLILVAGTRYDKTEFTNRRLDTNAVTSDVDDSTWVNKYGVVAKPYVNGKDELSIFYNSAETYVVETGIDIRLANYGEKFPNRIVSTDEFGAKLNLLNNRVVGTISSFRNVENNVLLSARDEDGSVTGIGDRNYLYPGGARTTDGWEADVALNLVPGLDLLLAHSKIESTLSTGIPSDGVPDTTSSVVARYEFQGGPLKGFSITGIYKNWGESYLLPSSNFVIPSGHLYTAVLGYTGKRFSIRLRIENVDDKQYALPSSQWTAVGVTNARNYRLSTTFKF